jgi:hypothetical protein
MTEELLHYIWKYKLLEPQLKLVTGEDCQIIETGLHNKHSGPDFFNARIKIGDTLWAGNVEIHVNASDWHNHGHQNDHAYDNIILHVVYNNDRVIRRNKNESLPTLEIKNRFDEKLIKRYEEIMNHLGWIPCEKLISDVKRFTLNNWLDRLMIERLEIKAAVIENRLAQNNQNWEETLYQMVCRNFGFKVNAEPFEILARSVPYNILKKHRDNLFQIESILFGQAGFLSTKYRHEYPIRLLKEYSFLREKYSLAPMEKHLWRFMRLRPSNFPTIRIAQLSVLLSGTSHLFSKIIESESINEFVSYFDICASEYWDTHYNFGKSSTKKNKKLGKSAVFLILVNTVIPFLFLYGRSRNNQMMIDRALKLLDQLPGESNVITRKWKELGIGSQSAFTSQALIELYNLYCSPKKCLDCAVGNELLRQITHP